MISDIKVFEGVLSDPLPRDHAAAVKRLESRYAGLPDSEALRARLLREVEEWKRAGVFETARRVHMDMIEAGLAPINSVQFITLNSTDPRRPPLQIPLWRACDAPAVYGVHWNDAGSI